MRGSPWMIAMLLGGLVAAGGCGKGSGGPSADFEKQRKAIVPPSAAKRDPAPAAEEATARAAASERTQASYAYDPLGKRDPFRSFVLDRLKEASDETKGPLEQFELQQLAVLGVVWDTGNKRALISDPSGQGYIVREGDPIGKNDGEVVGINDNLVLVRETYVDYVGEKTTKEIEMRVRQGQGGVAR